MTSSRRVKLDIKQDAGFTLIELVVGLLAGSLVLLAVTLLISMGLSEFNISTVNSSLQKEIQMSQEKIGKLIMEADSIYKLDSKGEKYDAYVILMGDSGELLIYDKNTKNILLEKIDVTSAKNGEILEIDNIHKNPAGLLFEATGEEAFQKKLRKLATKMQREPKKYVLAKNIEVLEFIGIPIDKDSVDKLIKLNISVKIAGKIQKSEVEYRLRNGKW